MKRMLSYAVAFALVLSCMLCGSVSSAENEVLLTEPVNLSLASGVNSFVNGTHSGHQTRVVHTSHGDYIAYLSDAIIDNGVLTLNEFSILKVLDGEVTLLYQDYVNYDSSSISIFADENEEVYAATLNGNKFNSLPGSVESANLAIWHVDTETDSVTGYTATLSFNITNGYGYAQPVMDAVNNKIYALFSGGDEPGELAWFIFDIATMSWESEKYSIELPTRYCYHYAYADGKGGIVLVNEQDRKAGLAGYPEILTAPLWPANYVWDKLDMFCIPDMYDDSVFYMHSVQDADYSRVIDLDGDGKYDSEEERKTNVYPGVSNNFSGDVFMDASGRIHVLYTVQFFRAAYDRKTMEETQWHKVFDVSDPANVKLLYTEQLIFDGYNAEEGKANPYNFRMAQDNAQGTLYIVAIRAGTDDASGRLLLYELTETDDGCDYTLVYRSERLSDNEISTGMCISGPRSLSVNDNTVSVMFHTDGGHYVTGSNESHDTRDWNYMTLTLPTV